MIAVHIQFHCVFFFKKNGDQWLYRDKDLCYYVYMNVASLYNKLYNSANQKLSVFIHTFCW